MSDLYSVYLQAYSAAHLIKAGANLGLFPERPMQDGSNHEELRKFDVTFALGVSDSGSSSFKPKVRFEEELERLLNGKEDRRTGGVMV